MIEHLVNEDAIPPGRNCVQVIGTKRDLFVEFLFVAGDPTLAVELVLPMPAFVEFCTINDVLMLPCDEDEIDETYQKMCWRYGVQPGRPDAVLTN